MNATRPITPLPMLSAAVVLLAACNGASDSVATTATSLTTAQCTYQGFDTAAKACFDTFKACKDAEGAVLADCRSALDACLPPPPEGSHPGHGPGEGGQCPGMGGQRPPNPDGGLPPPGGPGGPGGHSGPGGPGGPGGHGGRPPPLAIDSAELTACRGAFATCIAADPTTTDACRDTEHTCVRDAFRVQFQAKCEEGLAACALEGADAAACTLLTARCTQGVDGRPADAAACQ